MTSAHAPEPVVNEIVPGVYLADLAAAESGPLLTRLGITHVLSAMRGSVALPPTLARTDAAGGAAHLQVALEDNPFAELAAHLPATTAFLKDALKSSGGNARVLVHCVQGVSRSASVVVGYLVAEQGLPPARAIALVKARHPGAEPNFGFVRQLEEYAETLKTAGGATIPVAEAATS